MKTIRALPLFPLIAAAAIATSCNPVQPTSHPGQPPAVNEITPEAARNATQGKQAAGNVAPRKYGIPALLEYSRNQAGRIDRLGDNASVGYGEEQLRFGTTAGRNQTNLPRTYTDAKGQVHQLDRDRPQPTE